MRLRRAQRFGVLAALAACSFGSAAWAVDQPLAVPQLSLDPTAASSPAETPALALDEANPSPELSLDPNKWRFSLDFYTWAAGIDGAAGVLGRQVSVHESAWDIYKSTDSLIGIFGRLEVGKGDWTFFADGGYVKATKDDVGANAGRGRISVNLSVDLLEVTAGAYYRLGEWNLGKGGSGGPTLAIDAGPAGRLMSVGLQLNGNDRLAASGDWNKTWGDALGAAQLTLKIDDHWQLLLRGDAGGGMSDYTWSGTFLASYHFKLFDKFDASLNAGYQAVGDRYHDGGFLYNAILDGPVIFLGLDF